MWDLRAFVKGILRKRSNPKAGSDENLADLLKVIREQIEKTPGSSQIKLARAHLAEAILPKILRGNGKDGFTTTDFSKAQDYAFAMAHMIGLLAAITLENSVLDGAIEECLESAKKAARFARDHLEQYDKFTKLEGSPDTASTRTTSPSDARTQQVAMIQDLEKQAANEPDLAHAAALRAMAERMRKELRGENKERVA